MRISFASKVQIARAYVHCKVRRKAAGHYQGTARKTWQCAVWAQDAPINGPDAGLWGVTQAHFRPQWDPQYLQGLQLYFKEKGIHNFIFWAYNANGSAHQSSRLCLAVRVCGDDAISVQRGLCLLRTHAYTQEDVVKSGRPQKLELFCVSEA